LRDSLQNGMRVVVVNIQKFPSFKRLAKLTRTGQVLSDKRVAFVIDDVRRTLDGVCTTPHRDSTNGARSGRARSAISSSV